MNCECFYVVKNQTLEGARELAKAIDNCAERQCEEVYPVYISKIKKDFIATSTYEGFANPFKVKAGTLVVFAQGKDYCMDRIRPKGGRRGFPNCEWHNEFYSEFESFVEDIEPCESWVDRM